MLAELHIQNLAVVEDVTLRLDPALNVLTGSTGAGKSLILGAVNLLLGERGSAAMIRAGKDKAVVEGVFRIQKTVVNRLLEAAEAGGVLKLRRELHRNGRSQAFMNGRPCTIKQLQEMSRDLIEPHGQNEQLQLKNPDNHVVYVDMIAGNETKLEAYRASLGAFQTALRELDAFEERMRKLKEKQELLQHRLDELGRARLVKGEKKRIEDSLRILENSQDIFAALTEATELTHDSDASAVSLLSQARKALAKVAGIDDKIAAFVDQLQTAEITAKECARDIQHYAESLEFDPAEMEHMQERLAYLVGLERRYQMSVDDLIDRAHEWQEELDSVAFEDERRRALVDAKTETLGDVKQKAMTLHEARVQAAKKLDAAMTRELEQLMIHGARFRTDIDYETDGASELAVDRRHVRIREDGIDRVVFHVRTNPGEAEGAIADIASSGELSRIALALKRVASLGREGSVLVFDEVDAGVGADLGEVLAAKLLSLSASYQIVCITHMPQIAARAAHHLVVRKRNADDRTFTEVRVLHGDERTQEIARMLGGSEGSEKRLALAREMLQVKKSDMSPGMRP
jgi:DNA repair protein RecN (Recombination protein N)